MSSHSTTKARLAQLVPNAIGLLAFDQNCNVIEASGVAKSRLEDIVQINQAKVDEEGFALLRDAGIQVMVYKHDGETLAVYTQENSL
ncbi:LAQU0S09e03576g1_1 [Lachancea quebecensis]|uniref:LAQU0S09e03576g1_1 n=1 Tax=Lachancea quebecensis TaxID=1654605 RepID=A0A0P1KU27_9SACH|nr:LAQU0S09e03576g1_1 [Lachancea quebecensis]